MNGCCCDARIDSCVAGKSRDPKSGAMSVAVFCL